MDEQLDVSYEGHLSTYLERLRGTTQDTEADTKDTGGEEGIDSGFIC